MKNIFFTLIALSLSINAFTYNGFKSGMSKDDIIQNAQQKNLPLTCKSYTLAKEFKWSLLEKCQLKHKLRYYTKIIETPAYVTLYFTSNSNKLCRINIHWMINDLIVNHNQKIKQSELKALLIKMLTKKYGASHSGMPKNIYEASIKTLFGGNIKYWNIDSHNKVIFKSGMADVSLDYIDTNLQESAKQEEKNKRKKMLLEFQQKNMSKF